MKPNPEPRTPSSMSLSFPITVMLSPRHRVVDCKPMTRTLWHHAWGSLSLVLQHWKDFSGGDWASPLVTGEENEVSGGEACSGSPRRQSSRLTLILPGSAQMLLPQMTAPTPGLGEACQLSLSALLTSCTSPA